MRRTGQKHPAPEQLADLDSVDSDPPERDRPAGRSDAAESPFVCAEESPPPGDRLLHLAGVLVPDRLEFVHEPDERRGPAYTIEARIARKGWIDR